MNWGFECKSEKARAGAGGLLPVRTAVIGSPGGRSTGDSALIKTAPLKGPFMTKQTKETKKKAVAKSKSGWLAKFYKLFGLPALLPSDDGEAYAAIVSDLIQGKKPKTVIELIDIRDAADKHIEAQRFARLKVSIIGRRAPHKMHRQRLEHQIVADAATNATSSRSKPTPSSRAISKTSRVKPSKSMPRAKKIKRQSDERLQADVENVKVDAEKQLNKLENVLPTDADHAATFGDWIDPYERADRGETGARNQYVAALDRLEGHQAGLGLRHRPEEISDVEYHREPDPVSLAAPEATIGEDAAPSVPDPAEPRAAATELTERGTGLIMAGAELIAVAGEVQPGESDLAGGEPLATEPAVSRPTWPRPTAAPVRRPLPPMPRHPEQVKPQELSQLANRRPDASPA